MQGGKPNSELGGDQQNWVNFDPEAANNVTQPRAEPVGEDLSASNVAAHNFSAASTQAAMPRDSQVHFRVDEDRVNVENIYDEIPEDPAGYRSDTYTQVLRGTPNALRSSVPAAPADEPLYWGSSAGSDVTDKYLRFRQPWCKRWESKLIAALLMFAVIVVTVVVSAVLLSELANTAGAFDIE